MESIETTNNIYRTCDYVGHDIIPRRIINSDLSQVTEILGRPVAEIEQRMKPGVLSATGFIGSNEHLIERLSKDNVAVLERELSHEILSVPLWIVSTVFKTKNPHFVIDGTEFSVKARISPGPQEHPYDFAAQDRYLINKEMQVTNLKTGKTTPYFSNFLLYSIPELGFYEGVDDFGNDLPYRLSPLTICEVFELGKRTDST